MCHSLCRQSNQSYSPVDWSDHSSQRPCRRRHSTAFGAFEWENIAQMFRIRICIRVLWSVRGAIMVSTRNMINGCGRVSLSLSLSRVASFQWCIFILLLLAIGDGWWWFHLFWFTIETQRTGSEFNALWNFNGIFLLNYCVWMFCSNCHALEVTAACECLCGSFRLCLLAHRHTIHSSFINSRPRMSMTWRSTLFRCVSTFVEECNSSSSIHHTLAHCCTSRGFPLSTFVISSRQVCYFII